MLHVMGSCVSTTSTSTAAVDSFATAKVITLTGDLREYSVPVKVSQALGADYPSCFLCNSDRLYYDDYISDLDSDESLQLGQIYFVLPVAKLRYQLKGSEMAAMAVKASSALLMASGKGGKGKKRTRISSVMESDEGVNEDGEFGGISNYNFKTSVQNMSQWKFAPERKQRIMTMIQTRIAFGSRRARLSTIPEITERF